MKRFISMAAALGMVIVGGSVASAETISFDDPRGDDNGPGNYTYPTDTVYTAGSFDMTNVEFKDTGDSIEVGVTVRAKVEDPWDSKAWAPTGNGFSVQMIFVYLDTDKVEGSGHKGALPGLNVQFAEGSRWEKVLIISPQGNARLQAEVAAKAGDMKGDVVLPTRVHARGRKIVARFPKKAIGGDLSKSWGFQVLMQSNEGFPDKTDLLTRKVNEYGGQHRFGGGGDYDCDPHVIDMLAAPGKGGADEKKEQHRQLSSFKCNDDGTGTLATIEMVYPE